MAFKQRWEFNVLRISLDFPRADNKDLKRPMCKRQCKIMHKNSSRFELKDGDSLATRDNGFCTHTRNSVKSCFFLIPKSKVDVEAFVSVSYRGFK